MADSATVSKKLEQFLTTLSPDMVASIVQAIEKPGQDGDPVARMILSAARKLIRETDTKVPRLMEPQRMFAQPLEPFLVETAQNNKQHGRINRDSLGAIWNWLERDLIPDELAELDAEIRENVSLGKQADAEAGVRRLRERAAKSIHELKAGLEGQPDARLRMAGQLGGENVLDDAFDLATVFTHLEKIAYLRDRLPPIIAALEGKPLSTLRETVSDMATETPEIRVFLLALVMGRLQHPAEIVRLAKISVNSDASTKIEAHPDSAAVDLVLYDANTRADEVLACLGNQSRFEEACLALREYYELAHGLNVEIDISSASAWAKQITKMRARLSDRISTEIGDAPRQIKALLGFNVRNRNVVDESRIVEAENLLHLIAQCRRVSEELAINELLTRTRKDVEQYLNTLGDALVEKMRRSEPGDRDALNSKLEAAARLTSIALGEDIADLLRRAWKLAAQSAETEEPAPDETG